DFTGDCSHLVDQYQYLTEGSVVLGILPDEIFSSSVQ
ncbi:uncharacterized, partial [Tachysurus ichikawai]